MAVKIYGFVNDTSFYNRDYSVPGAISSIDQGAFCMCDKVAQMFGTLGFIRDTRTTRVPMPYLCDLTSMADSDLKKNLSKDACYLNGNMSFVFDSAKVTDEIKTALDNKELMNKVFSYLEIMGSYQIFENDNARTGVDASVAAEKAASYIGGADVAADLDQTPKSEYVVKDNVKRLITVNHGYVVDGVTTEFSTNRYARTSVVVTFDLPLADGSSETIELHAWFGEDKFLAEYPLCTITDAVLPCPPSRLYELLDTYKSVSAFASASSEYQSEAYNTITASNDHSGVYTFTTDYYAYPDTQPNNSFKISFGVVYKGHAPTVEEVKSYLYNVILSIIPAHTEEEWRKKLPGLIADRQFFMIPVYDNTFTNISKNITCRYGIFDMSSVSNIVRKALGADYVSMVSYAQLIMPKYSKYPVIVVPHAENPTSSRSIANLYPDYIGIRVTDADDSGYYPSDLESANTISFNSGFDDALANAAGDVESRLQQLSAIPNKYFVTFSPLDGATYYVLAKKSY